MEATWKLRRGTKSMMMLWGIDLQVYKQTAWTGAVLPFFQSFGVTIGNYSDVDAIDRWLLSAGAV